MGFYRFEDRKTSGLTYDQFRLSFPMEIGEMDDVVSVIDSYLKVHFPDAPEDEFVTFQNTSAESVTGNLFRTMIQAY